MSRRPVAVRPILEKGVLAVLGMAAIALVTGFLFGVVWIGAQVAELLSLDPVCGTVIPVGVVLLPWPVDRETRRALADRVMAFLFRHRIRAGERPDPATELSSAP